MARKSMQSGRRGAGVAKSRNAEKRASYRKMRDAAVEILPIYARNFLRNQTRVNAIKLYNSYLVIANQLGTDRLGLGPEPHRAQFPIVRRALNIGFSKGFIKNKGIIGSVSASLMEFVKNPAIQFAAVVATAGTAAVAFSGTATAATTTAATAATGTSILPAGISGSSIFKAGGAAVSAAGTLFEKEKKRIIDSATAAVTDPDSIAKLAGKAFGEQVKVVVQRGPVANARTFSDVKNSAAGTDLVIEEQKNKTMNNLAVATIAAAFLFA